MQTLEYFTTFVKDNVLPMKYFWTLLINLIITFSSFAITPAEIIQQIDEANDLRHKDCKSSIKPLYDLFLAANDQELDGECARALTYLGWALYDSNYPELSMQIFGLAQPFCTDDNTQIRDLISLGLGACYASTTDFVKGEKILLKSVEQSIAAGNKRETMMIYTYLGDIYSLQAKDSKSKEFFEKGRNLAHQINDTIFESALYCNIGTLEPDFQKSEANFFKSIDLSQQSGNKTTECYAYVNLSELYYNNKEYAKALRTAEQVNRLMPYIKSNDRVIAYSHALLSQIYAAQDDYANAYSQMQQAHKQTEIDNVQTEQERVKYSILVNEVVKCCEKHRLEQQKEESHHTFVLMLIVIFVVLLVAILYFVLYRQSRRQQRLLDVKNNEISDLQEASTQHITMIDDTRRTMNYLYGFYRGRNDLLEKISQMVKEGYKMSPTQLSSHLRIINNAISNSLTKGKEPEFVTKVDADIADFVERLKQKYPDISKTDISLAIYYRLGLSTREISRLTGKLPTTVTTARYRLRTSLEIAEDADLYAFFNAI